MHIVLAVLSLAVAASFWWYRLKHMRDAASEVMDIAGRARGAYRMKRIRSKASLSPLTAIDDPVIAAATVIYAIASEDVSPNDEERLAMLKTVLSEISSVSKAEEAAAYAKWAVGEIVEVGTVIRKLGPFLAARLNRSEKADLLNMLERVAEAGEKPPFYRDRFSKLRVKIGL